MARTRHLVPYAIAMLLVAPLAAACSSETRDEAGDAVESASSDASDAIDGAGEEIEETTDEAGARAAAEDLRARIKANDTADADGVRSVAALEESAEDVVGDPKITGIEDGDGDGLDDDGKVQVDVGDASACLTLPEEGEDTAVEGGAC